MTFGWSPKILWINILIGNEGHDPWPTLYGPGFKIQYRFLSLLAVDTFCHFGPLNMNSQIKSPFFTGKLLFWTGFPTWISEFWDKKSANNVGSLYDTSQMSRGDPRPLQLRRSAKVWKTENYDSALKVQFLVAQLHKNKEYEREIICQNNTDAKFWYMFTRIANKNSANYESSTSISQ